MVASLTNCASLRDDNKLRDVIPFAVSARTAPAGFQVDNISNLLVVALLTNCAVLRDDNKLRGVAEGVF